jgi:hypothetical protein
MPKRILAWKYANNKIFEDRLSMIKCSSMVNTAQRQVKSTEEPSPLVLPDI